MKATLRIATRILCPCLALLVWAGQLVRAQPKAIQIGTPLERSQVPALLAQDRWLPPQSVSALDVCGERIAVTTMAFRHDRNFWALSEDGKVLWGRSVLPWAPFQVAGAGKGGAFAAGLAYSRITPPYPTIALFKDEKGAETVLTDNLGERGWLRYGGGDWRTGWLVSALGDQVVRAGDAVVTIPTGSGAWQLSDDGTTRKLPAPFPAQRPFRLAASADGKVVAFGFIVPDIGRLEKGTLAESFRVQVPPALVSVHGSGDWKERLTIKAPADVPDIVKLPDPTKDFPELGEKFALRPDALLPFWVAASVAVNADGSRVAVTEYAGWLWIRSRPAIGKWDPPYHVIPFVPRQRGWLRVVDAAGADISRAQLPREGLFEVRLDDAGQRAWCQPMSWFARGMAGCAWRPADDNARSIFRYSIADKSWMGAWDFPDAIGDLALQHGGERALVSCWDGSLIMLDRAAGAVDITGAGAGAIALARFGAIRRRRHAGR